MRADIHTLTGAYAANALPDDERLLFEQHIAQCAACAQEVRELRETLTRLGTAAAEPPQPEFKRGVLAEVATVRQLPPDIARPPAPRGWLPRLTLVAAAVLALVALGLGALSAQLADRADRAERLASSVGEVLAAPDARTVHATTPSGGAGTVVAARSQEAAVLVTEGLPDVPRSRTYQLWLIGPQGARPAGLLPGEGPRSGPVLVRGLGDAERIGLTEEPSGGSRQPTSTPVLVVALPETGA
ncbi:MAG: anti-sigma factor [Carbonactinosporaceae bacterium]